MSFVHTLVILLAAAVVIVPLARRLDFGSVLGYLVAGLAIGPAGLRLVTDVGTIASISELGVVMLLFLIGLELRPARLWLMRRSVFGLGGAQVALTGAALSGLAHLAGFAWPAAVIAGFGLALSSTAIALPLLSERGLLAGAVGRESFAVLLFQDLSIIPLVAAVPLLVGGAPGMSMGEVWRVVGAAAAVVLVMLVGGRYLVRPIFRLVDSAKTPEIFTATALLLVVGTAALFDAAGLSMSLGAFMAGVLLSDSEYRHELEADIGPFEGLLLGFFFISVGADADIDLLLSEPALVLLGVAALLFVKLLISFGLARFAGLGAGGAVRFAVVLAQGSEFGFVLFGAAAGARAMTTPEAHVAMLVVTLSMVVSPLLFALQERWLAPALARAPRREFDAVPNAANPVIIAGFGRVGQIIGRVLRLRGIRFTALDNNAAEIDTVRRYGQTAYYGDPTRLDLLRAAGAAEAKILVVALDDVEQSLVLVRSVKRHFPHLLVLARARNRRHAHLLMDLGVTRIVRETFHSSLVLTEGVLEGLGVGPEDARRTIETFRERDERSLVEQHGIYQDEAQLIQTSRQTAAELGELFEADRRRESATEAERLAGEHP